MNKKKNIQLSSLDSSKGVGLKSIIGVIGAILGAILIYYLLPGGTKETGGLIDSARSLAAIFVAALILWATEAIPIATTSLLVLVLMPLLGVYKDLKTAISGFSSTVVFFVIASYILSTAVENSGVGRRFALWLITKTGTRSKIAVLVFMFGCATTSTIMSDVPACAIWMSLALPMLTKLNLKPGFSNFGKALMMGIPISALIGGVATPAGSSINILALSLLKSISNINITFVQWMGYGIPIFIIMTFVAWWIIIKVVPPEIDSIGNVDEFKVERRNLGGWNSKEIKTTIILATCLVLWIASSWVKQFDITQVAILASIVLFLPGIKFLKWDDVQNSVGWNTVLMIGAVSCLGLATVDTGLSKWVVNNSLGGIGGLNIIWVTLIISAFTVIIHIPIPINPAIIASIIPPIIALAESTGINPAIYALPVAFTTSCAFLLPLDAVVLVTYSKGYYRMFDMFVPGLLISIIWIILITILTMTLGSPLGFR
jgi:sodium-dependent dicarboxylate transporter 2/3/5